MRYSGKIKIADLRVASISERHLLVGAEDVIRELFAGMRGNMAPRRANFFLAIPKGQLTLCAQIARYGWGMLLHNAPIRQAISPTKCQVPVGAEPILWSGWLAGAIISLCLWTLIAAAVLRW